MDDAFPPGDAVAFAASTSVLRVHDACLKTHESDASAAYPPLLLSVGASAQLGFALDAVAVADAVHDEVVGADDDAVMTSSTSVLEAPQFATEGSEVFFAVAAVAVIGGGARERRVGSLASSAFPWKTHLVGPCTCGQVQQSANSKYIKNTTRFVAKYILFIFIIFQQERIRERKRIVLHLDADAFAVALIVVAQPLRAFFEILPTFPEAEKQVEVYKVMIILMPLQYLQEYIF